MKDLVNELIKPFLLEEKKEIVALYAGGFKPPTAGHLLVVEEALAKYPEIDKFIVVVGTGVRDEIDQEESLLVWEIYQNYLPMKVEIMPAKKPAIGEVYSYAKEHPEQTIYWVIGGREGREDDLNDIAVRTRAIDKAEDKYNNVEVKIITTPDSQMSGTNARKALLANDKEAFFKFLPARVKEKEEIFTILRPAALNEDLTFEKKRALIKKIIQMARSTGDLTSLDKLADMIAHKIVVPTEKKPSPGEFKVIGGKPFTENIDFTSLEKVLDDMFEDLDIDINFTKHFKERVIERGLTEEDIIELMEKIHDQYGDEVADLYRDENRVFTHLKRLVDIAAVNVGYGDDYLKDLVLKTAYKRNSPDEPEFKTNSSSPKLAVNEHSMGNSIDLLPYLAKLTQHMIDKGYNIEPLPGLTLVDDDISNAEDFFGKTAYYDPNEQLIVLYTHGRHPKDIARSYAHEMIHHIQNLEDRLGDITTTNTQEDDRLNDLEAEANLNGTMTFRNWTDSLQEKKNKDPFGLNAYARELALGLEEAIVGDKIECDNCGWEWKIADGGDDLYICHKCGHDNTPQLNEGVYDSLTTKLTKATIQKWVADFKKNPKLKSSFIDLDIEDVDGKGRDIEFNYVGMLKFDKKVDGYVVDGTSNSGEEEDKIPFIATLFTVNPKVLPQAWSQMSADVSDVIRHEIEHLTQSGENVRSGKYMDDDIMIRDMINKLKILPKSDYYKLEKEVDAMLQGLYLKAKKTRKPFADVINNYLDIAPGIETKEDKEIILNLWRSRRKALSLPIFENEEVMNYTIYSDMDGVLSDFDKRFMQFSDGIPPGQYEQRKGKEEFWKLIDDTVGVPFWAGMDWMPDGKEYWNYIEKYNPIILSAPSKNEESKYGKRIWKKRNMPNNKMILVPAWKKKEYATPTSILIDDRADNINQWEAAGGIGILHTDAASTIAKLKELGL